MIEASGLRKSYRTRRGRKVTTVEAVRGVDFAVQRGEIFGFLGPNGAGKTTTLRMLATLIRPDGGDATIAGMDLRRDPGGSAAAYWLRGADQRHLRSVHRDGATWCTRRACTASPKSTAKSLAEAAIVAFQLEDFADRNIGTYSGGQRRRLDVALGVIHSPQVIFLDEPTAGLDPPSRARMWQEVRRLRDEGMTIFLTTHYLDEADALCDRISIIDAGLIVAEGTPSDLKREISGDVVVVDLAAAGHRRRAGARHHARGIQAPDRAAVRALLRDHRQHPAAVCGQRGHGHPADHARAEQQGNRAGGDRVPAGRASTTCSWPRPAALLLTDR